MAGGEVQGQKQPPDKIEEPNRVLYPREEIIGASLIGIELRGKGCLLVISRQFFGLHRFALCKGGEGFFILKESNEHTKK